jgi:hypothetical protein
MRTAQVIRIMAITMTRVGVARIMATGITATIAAMAGVVTGNTGFSPFSDRVTERLQRRSFLSTYR